MDSAKLDQDLELLSSRADAWLQTSVDEKINYLKSLQIGTYQVAHDQVKAAAKSKGLIYGTATAAEDYLAGPVVQLRTLRLLINSLEEIKRHGRVQLSSKKITTRPDGQTVVQVFPTDTIDGLLYAGFSAEIWQERGVTPANLTQHMAELYRDPPSEGKVALVLGAGNVSSIGPLDVVHKLFVEGQVCMLKMNPVNEYLVPFIERTFAALIEDGFLRIAQGGTDVGAYLCQHPQVDAIHITGSDKTHDAIVYGTGEDGAARKANDERLNEKMITSELGNVSPVVIMPGSWTESEMRFQAENVATQLANNAGFNCNAAKVLIFHSEWSQKRDFMDMLKAVLATLTPRQAYYPGARARYDRATQDREHIDRIGDAQDGVLPWTFIENLDAENTLERCFREESFCSVAVTTTLPGDDAGEFLKNAVAFCNDVLWGTLNAGLIVDPRTEKRFGQAIDDAIARLRYGSVAINHWAGLCYGMGCTAWGAFPGHTFGDIQSGIGKVHNTYLFDRPEKTVLRGPFKVSPKPPWFVTHRNTDSVARKMMDMELKPSLLRVPGVALAAFKG